MAIYTYNPHRHIKIWLSNNPQIFMNLENQVRLIKMREKNPRDQIHLIHDSTLLSSEALTELEQFCKENSIIPVDAEQIRSKLDSRNERRLFDFYKDEINNLHEGGNLAVASDILRWLSPLYQLGSYSDFDYPVDTSSLPEHIKVEAPLLLNIGTLKIGKMEFILANNDYIAVVDEEAAKKYIERVQIGIINSLAEYSSDFIEKTEEELTKGGVINHYLLQFMKNRAEVFYIMQSNKITSDPCSSRQTRDQIRKIMSESDSFLEFNCQSLNESRQTIIDTLRKKLKNELNPIKYLFFKKEYRSLKSTLDQSDEAFISYLRKRDLELYLKSIIVCTTGPVQIAKSLFGYVLDSKKITHKVRPFSFNYYKLHKAFQSQNSIPLHENIIGMMRFMGVSEGEVNDSSWLETGRKLQENRTKKLEQHQQNLAVTLPKSLLGMKKEVQVQLDGISQKVKIPLFSHYGKAYKNALEGTLNCFHPENNEFDVIQFRALLKELNLKQQNLISKVYLRQPNKLLQQLEQLSHEAVVFRLTNNYKIKTKD